jgi:hypothetical protein
MDLLQQQLQPLHHLRIHVLLDLLYLEVAVLNLHYKDQQFINNSIGMPLQEFQQLNIVVDMELQMLVYKVLVVVLH